MTRLDRRERRGVVFTNCNNVTVRDVKIINSPEWSFISYCCTDVSINNVDIFGTRGNRDGIWDNDRIGSLVVVAEQTEGSIDGVLFENIEIFRDEGRPILVKIYDEEAENFEIKNIVFRNISFTSYMMPKIAGTDSDTNTVQVELDDITVCGNKQLFPKTLFTIGKYCDVTSD